jgi:hypothetical protein
VRIYGPVIVLALAAHTGLSAQQASKEPTSTEPRDIVVVARDPDGLDADAPDLANRKKGVVLGSRIPRYSLQNNPMLAMKTSPNGLTPGSGIDPYKEQRTVFWKSCRADGAILRKQVACKLVDVQKMISTGKLVPARLALEGVARIPDLSLDEQFATLRYQYRIADAMNDPILRRTALAGIVEIDVLPLDEQSSAVRSLGADAWNRGDQAEALLRFEQASRLDPSDALSRVNAAAALQATGRREQAAGYLRAAIAINRVKGQPVPQAWIDNAK